ncbi:MAG TPA: lipoyl(octanoyl) transferase LipB [Gemmatimonadaceae bacterium]|nr:lipoyl(octanoyl) transferase LipB [Gemmatimonadaceae bacterium]
MRERGATSAERRAGHGDGSRPGGPPPNDTIPPPPAATGTERSPVEPSSLDARRSSPASLWVIDLGRRAYAEVLELQRAVARARIAGEIPEDVLLLVEHPPVVTLGRSARSASHLVASPALLTARGVELFEVERGGDVTFHGPGQLVGYPIIDLKRHKQDLHWYLRQVEEALIVALARYGLRADREPKYTGVWLGDEPDVVGGRRKIASIGVHARDWVTWHGFALNVDTDLSYFDLIVPCGIAGVTMTSMRRELGEAAPDLATFAGAAAAGFGEVFGLRVEPVPPERLGVAAEVAASAGFAAR